MPVEIIGIGPEGIPEISSTTAARPLLLGDTSTVAGYLVPAATGANAESSAQSAVTAKTASDEAKAARDEAIVTVSQLSNWTGLFSPPAADFLKPTWLKRRLTGNASVVVPAGAPGLAYTVTVEVMQDAVGGRVLDLSGVTWSHGLPPIVTTTANARDLYYLMWTGSMWIGTVGAQAVG
jgi:hypothetical protein